MEPAPAGRSVPVLAITSEKRMTATRSVEPHRDVALQRTDRFVGTTMNWMYHHLRRVPRYHPVVMSNVLENRQQYPELEAFAIPWQRLGARIWRRVAGSRPYPPDLRRARGYRPVLLHSHFGYVGVADAGLQGRLGVPWTVAFYGADVYMLGRDPAWRGRYARLFEQADMFLALGPVMHEALVELGCPPEKVQIHPLGVDVEDIPHGARSLARGRTMEILFAGTWREKKGLVYLLEAAALLRRRGVPFRLHLVGEVSHRPDDARAGAEIEAAIGRLSLDDGLVRYSWLEFARLMELALRSHVFVAPSVVAADGDAEGTPFVIQQMMLSGMPVVSTRHSDIPFLFGPLADRLVPERDPVAIADRLTAYAEAPETVTADGLAMRQRMLEAFDIRRCAANLADLYDRLSGRGKRPS